MKYLALTLSTWFGCGYFPKGPGTAGSLGAIVVAWLLRNTMWQAPTLVVIFFLPAILSAGATARITGKKDPQIVVIDEVIGQWIALSASFFRGHALHHVSWVYVLCAFLLFRAFDIWKPWPVRELEKLPGGFGIVLDDVMAGIYAALVLYFAGWNNSINQLFYGIS